MSKKCYRACSSAGTTYDPFISQEHCQELGVIHHKDINTLIPEADFVSVSVPLTPQTQNLIDSHQFALFRKSAILVNAARGGVVNEQALYKALVSGQLFGAACDVFEQEPPTSDNPLFTLPNFIGSLHVGASTEEALLRVGNTVVRDVLAVLSGNPPEFLYSN